MLPVELQTHPTSATQDLIKLLTDQAMGDDGEELMGTDGYWWILTADGEWLAAFCLSARVSSSLRKMQTAANMPPFGGIKLSKKGVSCRLAGTKPPKLLCLNRKQILKIVQQILSKPHLTRHWPHTVSMASQMDRQQAFQVCNSPRWLIIN